MTTQKLYNANDGLTGRDGGPYLDREMAIAAEKRRAIVEGREPDLENPPVGNESRLVTAAQLIAGVGVNNLPSQFGTIEFAEAAVDALVSSDISALAVSFEAVESEPVVEEEAPVEAPVTDEPLLGA